MYKFEINFNPSDYYNDDFLINELGGKLEPTGATKYPPFEKIMIEIENCNQLEEILKKVDKRFETISSAVISFDPPTVFIEL
jgi:hypothetical protein